ncbi:MAG: cytochrome c3 family protein [Candidatus Rokubacteria bacterium]|nr:cytochrome c3 family protein [Candidatus Rokubacteria bacterium]
MSPRIAPLLAVSVLGGALLATPGSMHGRGGVYNQTRHADPVTGVLRISDWARGDCGQCHAPHDGSAPTAFALFAPNTNGLCYTSGCHSGNSANAIYQGPGSYDASTHATRSGMVWPGADATLDAAAPRARPAGDWGKCVNCHDVHGYNMDGAGLIPSLAVSREERLCLVCHDGSPAARNIKAEVNKAARHPVASSGRHSAAEAGTPGAYGAGPPDRRHAECVDCHNPHYARAGSPTPATTSYPIMGVGRISVLNGPAGSTPAFTYVPASSVTPPVAEYQLCFKCHSSWTSLPVGARDTAVEFNTNNESFHPVEGAGRNTTAAMTASLSGGTGTPRLTTSSTIWCSDCHNSDAIPTTVSTLSGYSGAVPKGPHGSNVGSADVNLSRKILRANYRVTLLPSNAAYSASNFTLCFICHASAPFADASKRSRPDTNFRLHGYHMTDIAGESGGVAGSLDTPGNGRAGQGNAVCKECHYTLHGTRLTYHEANRSYSRLVSFSPSISGPGGTGAPSWTGKSCSLRCHGKAHSPKTY